MIVWVGVALGGAKTPADGFDVYLKEVGEGLRNCGRVTPDAKDRGRVDDCVVQSFATGTPFVVRFDQRGIDSDVAEGLFLSRSKQLIVLHFDNWSCLDPRCTVGERCENAKIIRTKSGNRVECRNAYEM